MNIIWLGHGSFRIEMAGEVLLIDPWLTGNPTFPDERRAEALAGATRILITHGHGDHASEAAEVAAETGAAILAAHELAEWFERQGADALGMGIGGTVTQGGVTISMVPANHTNSIDFLGGDPIALGGPNGFVLRGEGHCLYASGDTGPMADMAWIGEMYRPDIGILSAGGHFTLDMAGAAWVSKKYFNFSHVIPGHYRTFGLLEQSADALVAGLPGVAVHLPAVMEAVAI